MKSLPLFSVEEMLLNHKQLFFSLSPVACVLEISRCWEGGEAACQPASPPPAAPSCPKYQGTQENQHPLHQVSVGWHTYVTHRIWLWPFQG